MVGALRLLQLRCLSSVEPPRRHLSAATLGLKGRRDPSGKLSPSSPSLRSPQRWRRQRRSVGGTAAVYLFSTAKPHIVEILCCAAQLSSTCRAVPRRAVPCRAVRRSGTGGGAWCTQVVHVHSACAHRWCTVVYVHVHSGAQWCTYICTVVHGGAYLQRGSALP